MEIVAVFLNLESVVPMMMSMTIRSSPRSPGFPSTSSSSSFLMEMTRGVKVKEDD